MTEADGDDDAILLSVIGEVASTEILPLMTIEDPVRRGRPPNSPTSTIIPRKKYNHTHVFQSIMDDYLGPNALFGSQFRVHFRISLTTFEYIYQEVMKSDIPFYHMRDGGSSVQARLLLPLKTLAKKCYEKPIQSEHLPSF